MCMGTYYLVLVTIHFGQNLCRRYAFTGSYPARFHGVLISHRASSSIPEAPPDVVVVEHDSHIRQAITKPMTRELDRPKRCFEVAGLFFGVYLGIMYFQNLESSLLEGPMAYLPIDEDSRRC